MNSSIRIFLLLVASLWYAVPRANGQVNVTQEHNNVSRDGVYIDAGFTPSAAANLARDLNFNGTISGNVYAQPLYIEGGPNGPMVIAVTESNNVYALNATTGLPIWSRTDIGAPVPTTPCGGFNPTGITGTPVVDLASRRLFFDALINGTPIKHFIYSLNVDTGATNAGWPVDVNATASYNGINFVSLAQEERGGLALVNGIVYVSYSGYLGDCGNYHGWVVGVHIDNPSIVGGWATTAIGGGIWGHGGVASDGTNMFVVTGNTFNTGGNWMGGEAIIRLQAGPTWTGQLTDYWAPTNWFSLDNSDTDLGGVSATMSMCLELHLRSLCSPWAKIAMPICLTGIISAASLQPWRKRMFPVLTEGSRLSHITPARERILVFIMTRARSGPTKLPQQIPPRSCLAGAKVRTVEARPGLRRLTAQTT
jgi:hypothetical protein